MRKFIQCIDHGVYGVRPEDCPLCPICDQPMFVGEGITLQTVDFGHDPDLLRLVHTACVNQDDDEDDGGSDAE